MRIDEEGNLISDATGDKVIITDVDIAECFESSARGNKTNIFVLNWDANIGFGQLTFIQKEDGSIDCETETMAINENKLFIKAVLDKFIEKLNVIE